MSEPVDIGGGIMCYQNAECRCACCMIMIAQAESREACIKWNEARREAECERKIAQEWRDECTKWRDRCAAAEHKLRQEADAETARGNAAEREAAEWRRLCDLHAQGRGRLAAAVMLAIGKAEALAHGPMSNDAIAAAVKDAVDSARGRGRFEADATGAGDDVDVMAQALGVLTRRMDEMRDELRAMKGECND